MDLVDLMYKYINKFINSDELLINFDNIDFSKYNDDEIDEINVLIKKIKNVKATVLNQIDDIEKNRLKKIDNIINLISKSEDMNNLHEKLVRDREKIRDGGELYNQIFNLLTQNKLINKYANEMNDEEVFDFITRYISAPLPPTLNQNEFNDLVKVGIKNDKREGLWRLAFNYSHKNIDFKLIEDYFIDKLDAYYLTELISAVKDDLNVEKLIEKIINSKNKDFIGKIIEIGNKIPVFSFDELETLSKFDNM